MEDENEDGGDGEVVPEQEDANAASQDFKNWLAWSTAHVTYLRCLLKLADRIDKGDDDEGDDGGYEDIEIDEDLPDDIGLTTIDIDQVKLACLSLINLEHVLALTEPLPQLASFSSQAEDMLDDLQESAFAIVTSLLFSKLPQVKQSLAPNALLIVASIDRYIKQAYYKCDRLSAENCCECLFKLV